MADASIWAKRVAEWRASGQTAAVYCARRGIGLSALRYWAQRSRRERIAASAAPEVRLVRLEAVATKAVPACPSAPIVIEVGAVRVLVERGVELATLVTVLEAVREGAGR